MNMRILRICKLCENKFKDYQNKKRNRCGPCNTEMRRYRVRAAAIKYLGGECKRCNWHGDQAALQFHYPNQKKREFPSGNIANKKWDTIKKELKKYILLCANCHTSTHKKIEHQFLTEALNYRGKKLDF